MKKTYASMPIFLLLISSCSNVPRMNNIAQDDSTLMKINLEAKFRTPASADDKPIILVQNENEFQKLMTSNDLEQFNLRLQLRLDAIEEVYFRSKESIDTFDSTLKTSESKKETSSVFFKKIINSGLYSRLLALRENNLARQNQIVYFLKRFEKILNDPASSQQETEYAKNAFTYIGKYFRWLPKAYLISHYQIALDTSDLKIQDKNWIMGIERALAVKINETDEITSMYQNYLNAYENDDVKNSIQRITSELNPKKTYIADEIKKAAYSIQFGLMSSLKAREPQSDTIQPSTGPSGNITGNTFPKNLWAITYDDGPHPKYTTQIANNLKEYGIKSTFFSLSKNVTMYPKITTEIKSMGMEIANHSHDHAQLTKLDDAQLDMEITTSTDKIEKVTGERTKFFRCPYGAGTNVARVRSKIAKENMVHVFWSVDSLDWQDRNPDSIVARVKKQMSLAKNGGGIILFHDIHPQSVVASKEIMKYLKENKAEVKTIGSIVKTLNEK